MLKIKCGQCSASFRLNKAPSKPMTLKCPKCKAAIKVQGPQKKAPVVPIEVVEDELEDQDVWEDDYEDEWEDDSNGAGHNSGGYDDDYGYDNDDDDLGDYEESLPQNRRPKKKTTSKRKKAKSKGNASGFGKQQALLIAGIAGVALIVVVLVGFLVARGMRSEEDRLYAEFQSILYDHVRAEHPDLSSAEVNQLVTEGAEKIQEGVSPESPFNFLLPATKRKPVAIPDNEDIKEFYAELDKVASDTKKMQNMIREFGIKTPPWTEQLWKEVEAGTISKDRAKILSAGCLVKLLNDLS